jgi:exopolysaccharide biosynthesis polyprenyl glycosylphosphotransferase
MAGLAEILDSKPQAPYVIDTPAYAHCERLIPGSARAQLFSEDSAARRRALIANLSPSVLSRFHPAMLATATVDLLLIGTAFAVVTRFGRAGSYLSQFIFYILVFLLFAIEERLYTSDNRGVPVLRTATLKTVTWTTVLCCIAFASSGWPAVTITVLWGLLNFSVLSAIRQVMSFLHFVPHTKNTLVIGDHRLLCQTDLAKRIGPLRQVRQVLSVDDPGATLRSSIRKIVRREFIDEVLVCTENPTLFEVALRESRLNRIDLYVLPPLFGCEVRKLETANGLPLVRVCDHRTPEWSLTLKRMLDFTFSGAACIALAPLLGIIALAIRIDSRGPILYRSFRVGRGGQPFACFKFRTMVPDADGLKNQLRARNERRGAFFKLADDPRVTRVGRILRRYSLDEIPQLLNVLRGEMSLVGPRPHPPDDVERYRLEDLQRLDFVPGMTGLWQITARNDPSFARAVALDREYIRNWSLGLDLRILFRTVPAVLRGTGA